MNDEISWGYANSCPAPPAAKSDFPPVSCEQAMVAASRRGLGMARTLCPDRERASIAVVAALIPYSSSSVAQIGAQGAR